MSRKVARNMKTRVGERSRIGGWRAAYVIAAVLVVGGTAAPAAGQVKISQLYGGGGNGGAPYLNDYIEIHNAGAAQNLSGWSVQYASSTGSTWSVTALPSVTLSPGQYLLIQEAASVVWPSGQSCALPTADATASLSMNSSDGKVALCNTTTALTGSTPTSAAIVDLVGYGTLTTWNEPGAPFSALNNAPPPSNNVALFRLDCGAADTNNNALDFNRGFPSPRNSATPAAGGMTGIGWAAPVHPQTGQSTRLTVTPGLCSNGSVPAGTTVSADLSSIGGSNAQTLFDDGTNGDEASGDGIYSYLATIGAVAAGTKNIPVTFTDGTNSGGCTLSLIVNTTAPANDNAATAQAIAGPYSPPVDVAGDFTNANVETNPIAQVPTSPSPPFFGGSTTAMVGGGGIGGRRGLWFTVNGTGNTLSASLCPTAPALDTVMVVMGGTPDGLHVVATGDDNGPSCAGTQASTSWCTVSGATYFIWVARSAQGANTSPITLRISDDGIACVTAAAVGTCMLTPAANAVVEVEPGYGVHRNDGCDTSPGTFTDIGSLGIGITRIAGTARGYGDVRDMDWYRFQSSVTNVVYVSVTAQFSARVSIESLGVAGACPAAELVTASPSNRCLPVTMQANLTAGSWYALRILHSPTPTVIGGVAVGATSYNYIGSLTIGSAPSNDHCASATVIAGAGTGPGGVNGTNGVATLDGSNPTTGCSPNVGVDQDVWYSFQPNATASWDISTCNNTNIDTVIEVLDGCNGNVVACNDNDAACGNGTQSKLSVNLSSTTIYRIRVCAKGNPSSGGNFNLVVVRTPPGNNVCGQNIASFTIPGTGGSASGDLTFANAEGNADSICMSAVNPGQKRDVFYYFTPSISTCNWTFSMCGTVPDVDTIISIHSACPTPSQNNQVAGACGDQGCGTGNLSLLSNVALTADQQYIIRVGMWSSSATPGPFTLTVSPTGPANDACSGATSVAVTTGHATVTASNPCAGDDGMTPSCGATSKDLWWTFTTGASQAAPWRIDTCGSAFDTVLTVFSGTCGSLTEMACNDDATGVPCSAPRSAVTVTLAANTTYKVRVASKGTSSGGAITLNFNFAAPPANDACTDAQALSIGAAAVIGDTTFATNDGAASCDPGDVASRDIWYSVSLSSAMNPNQTLVIDTCGSGIDTALAVYSDACGSLTQIACNDDCGGSPCDGTSSCVSLSGLAAGTYLVRVSDKGIGNGGQIRIKAAFALTNDDCNEAVPISCPSVTIGTNVGATAEAGLPASCDGPLGGASQQFSYQPGVWYKITPASQTTVTADTLMSPATSGFDTKMHVFTGSCGSLTCVTANDDIQGFPFRSKVAWQAMGNQDYYILIGGFSGATGNFVLTVACDPTPANDLCANATVISGASGSISSETTVGATGETNSTAEALPSCNGPYSFFDVFYQYTPPVTGSLVLDTCGAYDTVVSVHTACPTLTDSNQLAPTSDSCNDDGGPGCAPGSFSTVSVDGSTPYFIRVVGKIGEDPGGDFNLTWDLRLCWGCPGDLNDNGLVDGSDTQCFIDCVTTGASTVCLSCGCADMNNDLQIDLADVQPFVERLLVYDPECQ